MLKAPQLKQIDAGATLIDVSTTITNNYSIYHSVAEQLHALQEWTLRIHEESANVNGRTQNNKEKVR